jgi:hypothetical protein
MLGYAGYMILIIIQSSMGWKSYKQSTIQSIMLRKSHKMRMLLILNSRQKHKQNRPRPQTKMISTILLVSEMQLETSYDK